MYPGWSADVLANFHWNTPGLDRKPLQVVRSSPISNKITRVKSSNRFELEYVPDAVKDLVEDVQFIILYHVMF